LLSLALTPCVQMVAGYPDGGKPTASVQTGCVLSRISPCSPASRGESHSGVPPGIVMRDSTMFDLLTKFVWLSSDYPDMN
jgi:hypothetical protein